MSSLLLFIIAIPILEVVVMIKIGQQIGAVNTGLLIFLTAIIGVYFAKIQGLNTLDLVLQIFIKISYQSLR